MIDEDVSGRVIGAAIEVHRALGPGLLESAYEHCLAYELSKRRIAFRRQMPLPIRYEEVTLDAGYRLDFLVEDLVVVELKAVDALQPIHLAQMITYLKLSGRPLGLLLNFNVRFLRHGIKRVLNDQNPSCSSCPSW